MKKPNAVRSDFMRRHHPELPKSLSVKDFQYKYMTSYDLSLLREADEQVEPYEQESP